MPNFKNLKTYSKTQKVVNYSTLFDKEPEPYVFNSSSSSETTVENNDPEDDEPKEPAPKPKKTAAKRGPKKKTAEKENMAPKATKKTALPEPDMSEVVHEQTESGQRTTGKRKAARIDYNPIGTKRTEARAIKLFQTLSNTEQSSTSSSIQNITNGCGTTQDAPRHSTVLNDTCAEIDAKMKAVEIEPKTAVRGAKKAALLKSSNSASNLKAKSTGRGAKAAAAESKETNHVKVEPKKGGIRKSKSTSNVLTVKKAHLMNMNENKDELVKEGTTVKSIIKLRTEEEPQLGKENALPSKKQAVTTTGAGSKKAVKILDKIDDKNDQITKLKLDNRTKHAANTSTPSGLRRKPLKLPTNIQ